MTYDDLHKLKSHAEAVIKLIDGLPVDYNIGRFVEKPSLSVKTVKGALKFFLQLNPNSPLKVFK